MLSKKVALLSILLLKIFLDQFPFKVSDGVFCNALIKWCFFSVPKYAARVFLIIPTR